MLNERRIIRIIIIIRRQVIIMRIIILIILIRIRRIRTSSNPESAPFVTTILPSLRWVVLLCALALTGSS